MRSDHSDDPAGTDYWEAIAIEAAIHEGLTFLFNGDGVTEPANVEVPAPIATRMQVWPDVWNWLESGTSETNASVFEWSVEPPW